MISRATHPATFPAWFPSDLRDLSPVETLGEFRARKRDERAALVRQAIIRAGSMKGAACLLGVSPQYLRGVLREHGWTSLEILQRAKRVDV